MLIEQRPYRTLNELVSLRKLRRLKWSTRLSLRHLEVEKVSTLRLQSCHFCSRHVVPLRHGTVGALFKMFFDSFRGWATRLGSRDNVPGFVQLDSSSSSVLGM